MEKRIWSKPEMHEFAFAANEYVSTCYSGNCDIKAGAVKPKDTMWLPIVGEQVLSWWYKIFFAWDDKNNDNKVDYFDGEIGGVINDDNDPCNAPFNLEGRYQKVASPDILYYEYFNGYKPETEITNETVWETAYHFESGSHWYDKNTHLCSVLNESGKS